MKFARASLLASMLAASMPVLAANQVELAWTAVSSYADGTPLPSGTAVSYNVYQGVCGAAKTKVASLTAVTTTLTAGLANGSEYCWQVSSTANGMESGLSNEVRKAFPFPPPAAPTGLTAK